MNNSVLIKVVKKTVYYISTVIARLLPLWKEAGAIEALPPILYPVTPPVNIDSLPPALARKFVRAKIIPRRRIFFLKDVYVSGDPVVFKSLRIFAPSLPWLRDLQLYRHGNFLIKQWTEKQTKIINTQKVALVYDVWSASNYYHWIIESLPRLLMIQAQYPDYMILLPDPAPEFITVTTKQLGFKNVLLLKQEDLLKVAHLVMPELVYYYEHDENANLTAGEKRAIAGFKSIDNVSKQAVQDPHHKELIITVKEKILQHYRRPESPFRKIYISRSKQKTRRLSNEEDILPVLDKYGFEKVYFEGMSFGEQVSLMLETSIFIGGHGANMVNILFLNPGTTVIEMMNKDYINDAYYLLASSAHLAYYSVLCTMADQSIKPTDDKVLLNDAHLLVDAEELERVIVMSLHQP